MQAAVQPFHAQLETIELHPPHTPLLSSVDNRFIAEPASIRDGLAQQLTAPLDFIALTERLVREGVTLALEVGPQQVLSRLLRQTSDQVCVVPTDHAKLGASYQLQIVAALCEMQGMMPVQSAFSGSKSSGARSVSLGRGRVCDAGEDVAYIESLTTRSVEPHCEDSLTTRSVEPHCRAVVHFDATAAPLAIAKAGQVPSHAANRWTDRPDAAAPLHFDATQDRRQQRRLTAEHEVGQRSGAVGDSAPLPANSKNSIEAFLIDFVVEQTGYPAEIIELDWDIEADLGIDSIKKAQLFGELREFFDLESHASIRLDDYRSLRDIAELLHSTPGKADWLNQDHDRESSGASDNSSRATDAFPSVVPLATPTDQETRRPRISLPRISLPRFDLQRLNLLGA
ncbi:MAG: phosphopantetheine-binding protein [Pirellulaceae bacterium]